MKHIDSILKKYNIGISIDKDKLSKAELKEIDYKKMLTSIGEVRENEFNIYKNVPRLDSFIQKLLQE